MSGGGRAIDSDSTVDNNSIIDNDSNRVPMTNR